MRTDDQTKNPGREKDEETVAKHQIIARQGKTKQGKERVETIPKRRKTKSHSNLLGKLDSHGRHGKLAVEIHQKIKTTTNTPLSH